MTQCFKIIFLFELGLSSLLFCLWSFVFGLVIFLFSTPLSEIYFVYIFRYSNDTAHLNLNSGFCYSLFNLLFETGRLESNRPVLIHLWVNASFWFPVFHFRLSIFVFLSWILPSNRHTFRDSVNPCFKRRGWLWPSMHVAWTRLSDLKFQKSKSRKWNTNVTRDWFNMWLLGRASRVERIGMLKFERAQLQNYLF